MLSAKLDPNVRNLLEIIQSLGAAPMETLEPAEARRQTNARFQSVAGTPEPVHSVENLRIPGPAGEIPVRVYTPDAPAPRPAMAYFHGGGWVVCDLDSHD